MLQITVFGILNMVCKLELSEEPITGGQYDNITISHVCIKQRTKFQNQFTLPPHENIINEHFLMTSLISKCILRLKKDQVPEPVYVTAP
jgi:hypothetical protein